MREVPIERNQHALRFAAALLSGRFDMMIFLAGVGTRALTKVVETRYRREDFVEALTKVTVVARGPKPIAALKELRVPIDVKVPEPNTWRTREAQNPRACRPLSIHRDPLAFPRRLSAALQPRGMPQLLSTLRLSGHHTVMKSALTPRRISDQAAGETVLPFWQRPRRARRDPASPLVFHRDGIPVRRWRTAWRTACQAAGVPTRLT